MNEIVNLKRARKSKTRAATQATAAENRVNFGLTKARKSVARANLAKTARALDQARREP